LKNKYIYDSVLKELIQGQSSFDTTRLENYGNHESIESFIIEQEKKDLFTPTIILPDLSSYVILKKFYSGIYKAMIVGPRTKAICIDRSLRAKTMLFQIKPYHLFPSTSILVNDLVDQTAQLKDVYDQETSERLLFKYLKASDSVHTPISKYLPICSTPEKDDFFDAILFYSSNQNNCTVTGLAIHLGISERYLQKLTNNYFGIPPKKILKILRIHKSLYLSNINSSMNYSQLSYESGYYDQSHMIEEYQTLIGKTPKQLFG